jgi:hypothetical protein
VDVNRKRWVQGIRHEKNEGVRPVTTFSYEMITLVLAEGEWVEGGIRIG